MHTFTLLPTHVLAHSWIPVGTWPSFTLHVTQLLTGVDFHVSSLLLCFFLSFSGCAVGSSLRPTGLLVVVDRFSSHGSFGILVPQRGIEPMAPSLEGRFFTPGPSGKSPSSPLSLSPFLSPFSLHSCPSGFHTAVFTFQMIDDCGIWQLDILRFFFFGLFNHSFSTSAFLTFDV